MEQILYAMRYDSPVGQLLLVEKENALAGLWIEGQKYYPAFRPEEIKGHGHTEVLTRAKDWLDRYFAGKRPYAGELALAPSGSEFRKGVWKLLCDIPYGEVTTYGEIARKIALQRGREKVSARAVGGAVGHNPISIIIPCHRVVGWNGCLTGYAGGVEKKEKLLALEGLEMKTPRPGTGKIYLDMDI